jgi:phospholipid/cholesterol/gamma-HCH transport system substrate-binding protein
MNDRLMEFRVGIVILATIFVLAILIVFFGELPTIARDQYTLFVRFDEAPGVTVGTPVRKSGILIGRVNEVDLRDDGVWVTAKIDRKRKISNDEVCRISTNNIIGGDATLEFLPSNRPATGDLLQDGDYLEGYVARDPLQALTAVEDLMQTVVNLEGQVRTALVSIQGAGDEVSSVARSLNAVVQNNQEQFQRIMSNAEVVMNRFDYAMGAFDSFVGDEEAQVRLQQSIGQIPEVLDEARQMMSAFRSVAVRAEKNLANIEGITEPLGAAGGAFFDQIGEGFDKIGESLGKLEGLGDTLENLDVLIGELTTFSKSLNSPNGTIGQLVQNRELYDRLNRTVGNFEMLTRQIEPVVRDARVAMDKVARNPSRLGLQGLLNRQRSGLKY